MEATTALNKVCHEVGVCDSEPGIKHAAELFKDGAKRVVRVACWSDGKVTSCVVEKEVNGKTKREMCCYTAESGGDELYFAWVAHLCSNQVGYKEKRVEVD